MTFEEFIKNHVRVAPEGKHIELTSIQYAFIDWLEKCKQKGLKPFNLKMSLDEYLVFRFKKNNINKYLKYLEEWISGVTEEQKLYFQQEKERLRI